MLKSVTVLVLLGVCLPRCAAAQSQLSVGDSSVQAGRLPRGVERFDMVLLQDGRERVLGTYELEIQDAEGMLLVTQRTLLQSGSILDSAWVDATSFAPERQVSRGVGGLSSLAFHDLRVTGSRTDPFGKEVSIAEVLAAPVFSASLGQLLIRTLPLQVGLHVTIPVYREPGGVGSEEVEVVGMEAAPGAPERQAWRVRVTFGDQAATVWVDPTTLRELRTEAEMPGGVLMIMRPGSRTPE